MTSAMPLHAVRDSARAAARACQSEGPRTAWREELERLGDSIAVEALEILHASAARARAPRLLGHGPDLEEQLEQQANDELRLVVQDRGRRDLLPLLGALAALHAERLLVAQRAELEERLANADERSLAKEDEQERRSSAWIPEL